MKHTVQVIIYKGMEKPLRQHFDMPDVSIEDFDTNIHHGKIFMWNRSGKDEPEKEMVYMWNYCTPENDEEKNKLIELGKWAKDIPSIKTNTNQ